MDASIRHPRRCVVGNCPDCAGVIVITADGGSWPLCWCPCGWSGSIPPGFVAVYNGERHHRVA